MQESDLIKDLSKEDIAFLIRKDNPLILDIGTYDGNDSSELSDWFPFPKIHCFEADPRSQELFKRVSGSNPFLELHRFAVGDVDGDVDLWQSESDTRRHYKDTPWSASSSLSIPKEHLGLFPDVYFENKIKVPGITLDTWYQRYFVESGETPIVDFIWADVNGAEGKLIVGAQGVLRRTRFLYIEFSDKELYDEQINKEKMLSLLPDFTELGVFNFRGNFGNVLLKNKNFNEPL